jgi:drug/metabolite transporter (DMT)-like permease
MTFVSNSRCGDGKTRSPAYIRSRWRHAVAVESGGGRVKRHVLMRHAAFAQRRVARLDPVVRGLLWSMAAGLLFVVLNTLMRSLTLQLDPFQTQFLRYVFGLLVMLPLVARSGLAAYRPRNIGGQFLRGAVHTLGLTIWFTAIPHITLADTTAIGFTGPIFIMIGAAWAFGERMRWERWLAAAIGLAGVLIVVAPKLSGAAGVYTLLMLASIPVFAASFLITKGLTRYERPEVIVLWQSITVTLFSLPLALPGWQAPTAWQWLGFLGCGVLGSAGHYCLARSFSVADISATQSVKFLDLVWASLLGWLVFADAPSRSTLVGGVVICASTLWIARREARGRVALN